MLMKTAFALALSAAAGPAAFGQSQIIDLDYDAPTLDRWNYPFNGSPGTRLSASTFGAIELEGFDDHDAQLVLGFETGADVTAGLDSGEYQVLEAVVTITNSNGGVFRYDPTYDTHDTYLFLDNSLDLDAGRPVHLWAAGYRNGFDVSSWGEYSAFGGTPAVEPAQESRHLFAAYFPNEGSEAVDISNNLKQEFDATPMAIGMTDSVLPGEFVPADTALSFEVDLCQPGIRDFLAQGLSDGEVRFVVTSLHEASGGKGGGTGDITYPFWYTKENPIAQILGYSATLDLRVRVGSVGDYNGDGQFNFFDVSEFLSDFSSGDLTADVNNDCTLNFFDISQFLAAFNAG
ncbi:MAG: GC-type dockerin domain-anchored protein [Phycisphaerales bacterium]